jgi:GTPase
MIQTQPTKETAILVALHLQSQKKTDTLASFKELEALADGLDITVVDKMIQSRSTADVRYLIGKGKIEQLVGLLEQTQADMVIFDNPLTIGQIRNIENILQCKVLERTGLILEIFSRRARTKEAKLQVELAQLSYQLSRLTRMWTHLSRIKGGIGFRGPGELQLEVDRRVIRKRITLLKKDLRKVEQDYGLRRKRRGNLPFISLVGYTNAGKSTLFQTLTHSNTFIADKLFATLDPQIRRIYISDQLQVLCSDTVGFIRNLPHQLVASFQSTLKEVQLADLIIQVVDQSEPFLEAHLEAVESVLTELDTQHKPRLLVFNKADQSDPLDPMFCKQLSLPYCSISAKTGEGISELKRHIEELITSSGTREEPAND